MIQPPPRLRNHVMAMKGSNLTFLMEKTIGDRDRFSLSLPLKQLKAEFLTELDKALLKQDKMDVLLVEPSLETCRLTLKRWEASNSGHPISQSALYVLGRSSDSAWNKIVSRNELRKGNSLGVWSFRIGVAEHALCFAIDRLDDTENERDVYEEERQDLLNISPGYFSESDWIDSYYDNDSD